MPRVPGKLGCTACGTFTTMEAGAGLRGVSSRDVVPFSEIQAAAVERVKVGGAWDACFGGGIPEGTAVVLSGPPGGGKSTILQQRASDYAGVTGKWVYYLSAEQSSPELKLSLDRLKLAHIDRILGLKEFGAGATIDEALFKSHPPCVLILDSVSALCGKDRHAAVEVCRTFKRHAVRQKAIAFLIMHMSKAGDVAGLQTAIHDADVLATVWPAEDDDPARYRQMNARKLQAWKSRIGPALVPYFYEMTAIGLVEIPPDPKKERRDAQEAGLIPVRDTNTLAGCALEIKQVEDELRDTQASLKAQLKRLKDKQVALAVAEPEKPTRRERLPDIDVVDEPAPPRKPARKKPAPPTIVEAGQTLVQKPRGTKAKLRLLPEWPDKPEGP